MYETEQNIDKDNNSNDWLDKYTKSWEQTKGKLIVECIVWTYILSLQGCSLSNYINHVSFDIFTIILRSIPE